ncbi:hypothetical protein PQJ75_25515 [Rhodoplanes sp. TEM]|uniref:DUF616 domain-containing protein n=1 Tax=Rhodoplanes tepidamans TaxID=200616 RepID=A0ABT5JGK3_RHOTP|nr:MULTISPECIES: hypothetical protein [Rhodoplanes]MDC7788829.1 hypothetical protein [Rhodoplanes tepidamans]MDC7987104.1 hypothetical protein [Rhodoplanes sp. TEM]MDQ0357499.1 hypothetical protein [Rhodoplanes tepidamans]
MTAERVCVYTALTGDYERLNEQPVAARSSIPFVCITDDPELTSTTWQVRRAAPTFGLDPVRSQREWKMLPHVHLPEFDASLYIDNTVLLREPPERLLERLPESGLAMAPHSFRASVEDEFVAVMKHGLDETDRVLEQLHHLAIEAPELLQEAPWWTGLMIRDHRRPAVQAAMETWRAHMLRYSRRDQLSINLALHRAGLTPDALPFDNNESEFHVWPHRPAGWPARRQVPRRATALTPLLVRLGELEAQVRQRESVADSPAWLLAEDLSRYADRHPGRRLRLLLRAVKLIRRWAPWRDAARRPSRP